MLKARLSRRGQCVRHLVFSHVLFFLLPACFIYCLQEFRDIENISSRTGTSLTHQITETEKRTLVSDWAKQLTSLLVAVAGGKKRSVARQQLDWQRFDPPHQRHRHPRVLDWHHPRHRGHPATVLEQPEEKRRREASRDGRGGGG